MKKRFFIGDEEIGFHYHIVYKVNEVSYTLDMVEVEDIYNIPEETFQAVIERTLKEKNIKWEGYTATIKALGSDIPAHTVKG